MKTKRYCFKCHSTKDLHVNSVGRNGRTFSYICRKCSREKMKAYRKTDSGRKAVKRAVERYEQKHPERRLAWNKAMYYVSGGKKNSVPCNICGKFPTDKHHPDISKALEVVFLCRVHHTEAHRLMVIK